MIVVFFIDFIENCYILCKSLNPWSGVAMLSRDEILSYLQKNRRHLTEQYHIKKIGIFGSFANNRYNKDSDIDIIVEFEENTDSLYEIKQELRALLQEQFNRDVDIAREKYLKPYIKHEILKEAVFVE